MTREEKYDLFKEIAMELADTLDKKNTDYGDNVLKIYQEFGELVPVIRLSDKLERLKTYAKRGELLVEEEGVMDIYRDIAGYAILYLAIHKQMRKGE